MANIYGYNEEFSKESVIEKINDITEQLEEEQSKPLSERDREKELELVTRQLIMGMRLSTGFINLYK